MIRFGSWSHEKQRKKRVLRIFHGHYMKHGVHASTRHNRDDLSLVTPKNSRVSLSANCAILELPQRVWAAKGTGFGANSSRTVMRQTSRCHVSVTIGRGIAVSDRLVFFGFWKILNFLNRWLKTFFTTLENLKHVRVYQATSSGANPRPV